MNSMDQLSREQIEVYHEAFAIFDKDGNGSISKEELRAVMKNLNVQITEDELRQMIIEHDADESGQIEFDEFCDLMVKSNKPLTEEEKADNLQQAFKTFDSDDSGFITKDELKTVMNQLGENLTDDEIESMIREADTNGDGEIDYHEFVSMMQSKS